MVTSAQWLILVGITALQISVSKSQEERPQEKKPQSVRDLLNTTSCIQPPYRCPHPKMQFYLYTRTTQEKGELINTLDNDSLTYSKFNTKHPTKVVVHGFGGGRNLSPSTDMRKAYFTRGNYNIIIVDYGSLVKEPCLSQIEWAPRFASLCITQLIEYLQNHPVKSVPPEKLHTIGYSVGAHILGLVANYLHEGKLGRITGKSGPDYILLHGVQSVPRPRLHRRSLCGHPAHGRRYPRPVGP
ncbi:unnamed protein product [Spodoptera littoralis]|uniref:Lipase domain-containing protein n=1 Tax=Spodoptera littoralis TaxID=7109 RepID=A0A9P0N9Q9_SPOLI|nr:unnamed protein product [Spodoptera littoralis]